MLARRNSGATLLLVIQGWEAAMPRDWLDLLDIEVHRLAREALDRTREKLAARQEGLDYPADVELRCAA